MNPTLKPTNHIRNNLGLFSLFFGVISMFLYPLLLGIPQIAAIVLGFLGINFAKKNVGVSKWQSYAGLVLGIIYSIMFIITLLGVKY